MNGYDRLLEWASERGEGSWRHWRDACEALALDEPTLAARRLSALGHVEFDWVSDRFACAPPTAVLTLNSSGCLLVTGARPRGLRNELETLWASGDFDVDLKEPLAQEGGPATWLVEAEMDELERFCERAGLELHVHSGRRIAEALPRASLEAVGEPVRPDGRFPRRWFQPTPPLFPLLGENPDGTNEGLWWVEAYRREVAFVCRDGQWWRIPVREYGPYVAYAHVSFISYHEPSETLMVGDRAPLPQLLARALTLQSGRLPKRRAGRHSYVNVDPQLAELVADRLNAYIHWQ